MMLKTLTVFALLATATAKDNHSVEELITDLFQAPIPHTPSPEVDSSNQDYEENCNTDVAKCVRYYLCDYQYKSDDKKVADLIHKTADSYCPSYLDVCCIFDAIIKNTDQFKTHENNVVENVVT